MNLGGITLDPELVKAIKEMGYSEFTSIQLKTIPEIQKGHDIIGQSKTGSGKTAAFGLPILEKVVRGKGVQALILTPTRELCVQVAQSMRDLGKYKHVGIAEVYGGVGYGQQVQGLKTSEIAVGTPGRVLDHIGQRTLHLSSVKFFVLDETDRMADMGFINDVERIMSHLPGHRQTLLFSATITRDVDRIAEKHMRKPSLIQSEAFVETNLLEQVYYDVSGGEKFSVLVHLLKQNAAGLSLVFCRTRSEVDVVAKNLSKNGVNALAIHGGLTQGRRLRALESLHKSSIDILVATDVAARGLDIKGVNFIYNYDVPQSQEDYIHRIGRTARAGANGKAITLLAPSDHYLFRDILRNTSIAIKGEQTPEAEHVVLHRQFKPRRMQGGRPFGGHGRGQRGTGYGAGRSHSGFGAGHGHSGFGGGRGHAGPGRSHRPAGHGGSGGHMGHSRAGPHRKPGHGFHPRGRSE